MENITPGYYWAREKQENSELEVVEVYALFELLPGVCIYRTGFEECFSVDGFELIQKIELPEFILDKLDGRDYEDNKRPTPSLQ